MRDGGFIIPNPREESDGRRRASATYWGTIAVPPEKHRINSRKLGAVDEIFFLVASRKRTFQRMHVRPDNPFYHIACMLQQGERVFIAGEYTERDYTKTISEWDIAHNKKYREGYEVGDQVLVTEFDMTPQWIIPEQAITDPIAYQQRFLRPSDPMYAAGEDPDLDPENGEEKPETSWF